MHVLSNGMFKPALHQGSMANDGLIVQDNYILKDSPNREVLPAPKALVVKGRLNLARTLHC
eukprot:13046402-Alexandrium_andersonii.AAC.1